MEDYEDTEVWNTKQAADVDIRIEVTKLTHYVRRIDIPKKPSF